MRSPPTAVHFLRASPLLRGPDDLAAMCAQIQHDPTSADLVIDLRDVRVLDLEAARTLRDNIFWRIHWSRVGCVVTDTGIAATLTSLHVDHVAVFGETCPDVLLAMHADPRPPAGRTRLVMGPGPAVA